VIPQLNHPVSVSIYLYTVRKGGRKIEKLPLKGEEGEGTKSDTVK